MPLRDCFGLPSPSRSVPYQKLDDSTSFDSSSDDAASLPGDERRPLLPPPHIAIDIPFAVQQTVKACSLSIDGNVIHTKSGVTIGLRAPDRAANPSAHPGDCVIEIGDPAISKDGGCSRFFKALAAGLSLASGASGVEGALEKGLWEAVGSWGSTSTLNLDGALKFIRFCYVTGFKISRCLLYLIILGAVFAAMPPAVLAGEGVAELIDASRDVSLAIKCIFGFINFLVSAALNIESLYMILPGIREYFNKVRGNTAPVWRPKVDMIMRIVLFFLIFPMMDAAMIATIARGHSAYNEAEKYLTEIGAHIFFTISGFVGFAMFFKALLSMTLLLERMVKAALSDVFKRPWNSFGGGDLLITALAMAVTAFAAIFSFMNYQGLVITSYKADWIYAYVIRCLAFGSEQIATIAGPLAATMNLMARIASFKSYFESAFLWAQFKRSSEQKYEEAKASAETVKTQAEQIREALKRQLDTRANYDEFVKAIRDLFSAIHGKTESISGVSYDLLTEVVVVNP